MDIKFINLMAFVSGNREQVIIQWEEAGEFKECSMDRRYNSEDAWHVESGTDKLTLARVFTKFVEQLEVDE